MEKISNETKSHFLRLYKMALTDDNFSPLELKMLYAFARSRDIGKRELDHILLTHTEQLIVPDRVEKKIEYLYDLAQLIWADGVITEDERNALKKYCLQFRFLEENIDELTEYLLNSAKKGLTTEEIINQLNE